MDVDKIRVVDSILSLFTRDELLSSIEEDNYRQTFLLFFDTAMTAGADAAEEQDDQLLAFLLTCTNYVLHNMPYTMFLKTRYWQNRRNTSLELAGHKCQLCNASQSLQVHHRTYERRGYEKDSDLIVLCKSCHQLFHDNKRISRKRG